MRSIPAISAATLLLTVVALLAACGGDTEETPSARPTPYPRGSAISVADVLALDDEERLHPVKGYLIEKGSDVRLCEAQSDAVPPDCLGLFLRVEGWPPPQLDRLATPIAGAFWAPDPTVLCGPVIDGTLYVTRAGGFDFGFGCYPA